MEETKLRVLFQGLAEIDARREDLERERESASRAILDARSVDAYQLTALGSFCRYVASEKVVLAQRRAESEKRVNEQRRVLVEARRKTRLIEKLRERRLADWQQGYDKELEDLASEAFLARVCRDAARRVSQAEPEPGSKRVGPVSETGASRQGRQRILHPGAL